MYRTNLLKRIYDDYDLNVKMYEKPVGFALKNNDSNIIYIFIPINILE